MDAHTGHDETVWRSDDGIADWLAAAGPRESRRGPQRRLMAELLGFDDEEPFVLLDLGAGTGAAARAVLDRYPAASAVLVDFSPQLIEAGTAALEPYRGRFIYLDVDLGSGAWPPAIPDRVDAVITSMFLHHVPDARKEQLIAAAFERLAPGGWFLAFDLVSADDPGVAQAWRQVADRLDDAAPERHHPAGRRGGHELHVSPLARQLGFLRDAGFETVDTYWKALDAVIIGGRRPS